MVSSWPRFKTRFKRWSKRNQNLKAKLTLMVRRLRDWSKLYSKRDPANHNCTPRSFNRKPKSSIMKQPHLLLSKLSRRPKINWRFTKTKEKSWVKTSRSRRNNWIWSWFWGHWTWRRLKCQKAQVLTFRTSLLDL